MCRFLRLERRRTRKEPQRCVEHPSIRMTHDAYHPPCVPPCATRADVPQLHNISPTHLARQHSLVVGHNIRPRHPTAHVRVRDLHIDPHHAIDTVCLPIRYHPCSTRQHEGAVGRTDE